MTISRETAINLVLALLLLAVPFIAMQLGKPFYVTLATRMAILGLAAIGLNIALGLGGLVSQLTPRLRSALFFHNWDPKELISQVGHAATAHMHTCVHSCACVFICMCPCMRKVERKAVHRKKMR